MPPIEFLLLVSGCGCRALREEPHLDYAEGGGGGGASFVSATTASSFALSFLVSSSPSANPCVMGLENYKDTPLVKSLPLNKADVSVSQQITTS